jgi:hypothetical protein
VGGSLQAAAAIPGTQSPSTHRPIHDIAELGEQAWDDLGAANNWVNNQVDDLGHDVGTVLSFL